MTATVTDDRDIGIGPGRICRHALLILGDRVRCGMFSGCESCLPMIEEERKVRDNPYLCFGRYRSDSPTCERCIKAWACAIVQGNPHLPREIHLKVTIRTRKRVRTP